MIFIYNLLATIRFIVFLIAISTFFIVSIPLYPIYLIKVNKMRVVLVNILSFYSKFCMYLMGLRIEKIGLTEEIKNHRSKSNFLIIGNHMSYLDVLIISHIFPSSFITSTEMRDVPFLGLLCKLVGSVFVERRNKKNIGGEIKEIIDALKEGLTIAIFPEATSTNGDEVIRFKRPLFRAAMETNIPVLPITLNYNMINNRPVTKENRDSLCWYGDMTFLDHLWGIFKTPSTDISITISDTLSPDSFEDHVALSTETHRIISSKYNPFT